MKKGEFIMENSSIFEMLYNDDKIEASSDSIEELKNYLQLNSKLSTEILTKMNLLLKIVLNKSKPFVNLHSACDYLNLSKHTIYSYTSRGILPFYKLQGRRIYFCVKELDDFILNRDHRV